MVDLIFILVHTRAFHFCDTRGQLLLIIAISGQLIPSGVKQQGFTVFQVDTMVDSQFIFLEKLWRIIFCNMHTAQR